MFPDSQYAHPEGSFRNPVPLVNVDPDSDPTVQICINPKWIPYIVGALKQLLLQSTWRTSNPDDLNTVQGRVFDLIGLFSSASTCQDCDKIPLYEEFIEMVAFREDCDCNLYYKCCDGTEKLIATAASVPAGGQPGAGSPQAPPGGGTAKYCTTMQANNVFYLPTVLNTGDVVSITSAVGAATDGNIATWYCPDGGNFFAGVCSGGRFTSSGDPVPTDYHMRLIINVAGTFYAFDTSDNFTVPSGVSNAQAFIQSNDSSILDNSGSYDVCVTVVNNQTPQWTHLFNFLLNDGGWVQRGGFDGSTPTAVWHGGIGWQSNCGTVGGTPDCTDEIKNTTPIGHLSNIAIELDYTNGILAPGERIFTVWVNGTVVRQVIAPASYPDGHHSENIPVSVDSVTLIEVLLQECTGTCPTGSGVITSITLSGTGTNPF